VNNVDKMEKIIENINENAIFDGATVRQLCKIILDYNKITLDSKDNIIKFLESIHKYEIEKLKSS